MCPAVTCKCGNVAQTSDAICKKCGSALPSVAACPKCGVMTSQSNDVCTACGATFASDITCCDIGYKSWAKSCVSCGKPLGAGAIVPGTFADDETAFFAVSPLKFTIMSIVTFGLYEIFWQFSNWLVLQRINRLKIYPGARAFFGYFFVHKLFRELKIHGTKLGCDDNINTNALAWAWIIISLCYRLPPPFDFIAFLSFVPQLRMNMYLIRLNKHLGKGHLVNSKFSVANWIGIVLGTLMLLLAIVSPFLSDGTN